MANVFDNVGSANLGLRYDQDGRVWAYAKAHGALTADTPYLVKPANTGWVTAAIGAVHARIGVPAAAVDSGDYAWVQVGGPKEDMAVGAIDVDTVGHFWEVDTGAIADGGTTFDASTFAVATAATDTTADTCDVILLDKWITGT